jgi:hypothetical protein
LKRQNKRYGLISMCIGTGMGAACVIEREWVNNYLNPLKFWILIFINLNSCLINI